MLLQQVLLVAHARGWSKDKAIAKLADVAEVLNGGNPSAHSERNKSNISDADKAYLENLEKIFGKHPPESPEYEQGPG